MTGMRIEAHRKKAGCPEGMHTFIRGSPPSYLCITTSPSPSGHS